MKILVNSCVRGLDSIRVRESRQSCAAWPHEGWRHAVSKFRRAVSVKITISSCLRLWFKKIKCSKVYPLVLIADV